MSLINKKDTVKSRAVSMFLALLMLVGLAPIGIFPTEVKADAPGLVGTTTSQITDASGMTWAITKTVQTYDAPNAPCDYYKISTDMTLVGTQPSETADIVFVMDYSSSTLNHVNGNNNLPTIFSKQVDALHAMVNGIRSANNPGVRIGLVGFSGPSASALSSGQTMTMDGIPGAYNIAGSNRGSINGVIDLTTDYDSFLAQIGNIPGPKTSQHIMTNTQAGLLKAKEMLDAGRPGVDKQIILITDGFPQGSLANYDNGSSVVGTASERDTFANANTWDGWSASSPRSNTGLWTGNVGAILARRDAAYFGNITITAIGIFGGLDTRNPDTEICKSFVDSGDANDYGFWNGVEFLRDICTKDTLYAPDVPDYDADGSKGYQDILNVLAARYPGRVVRYSAAQPSGDLLGSSISPSGGMIDQIAAALGNELKIRYKQSYTFLDTLIKNSDGVTDGFSIDTSKPSSASVNGINVALDLRDFLNTVTLNAGPIAQYISDPTNPSINIHMDYVVRDDALPNQKRAVSQRKFSQMSITVSAQDGAPPATTNMPEAVFNTHAAQTSLGGPEINSISLARAPYDPDARSLAANEVYFNQTFDLVANINMAGVKDYIKHIWVFRGPSSSDEKISNDEPNGNIYKYDNGGNSSNCPVIYDSGDISSAFDNATASLAGGTFTLKNLNPRASGTDPNSNDYYVYVIDNAGCYHYKKLNVVTKIPTGYVTEHHINLLNRQAIGLNPGAPIDVNPKTHTAQMREDETWPSYSVSQIVNFLKPYDLNRKLGWIYRGVDSNGDPVSGDFGFVDRNVYFLYEPQNPNMSIVKSVNPTSPVRPTNPYGIYPATEKNLATYSISDISNIGNVDINDGAWSDIFPVRNGVPVIEMTSMTTGVYNGRSSASTYTLYYRTTPYDATNPNNGWITWDTFTAGTAQTFNVADLNLPAGTRIYGIRVGDMGTLYCADGEQEGFRAITPATISGKVVYDGYDVDSFEAVNSAEIRGTYLYNPGNGTDNYEPVVITKSATAKSTVNVPTGTITDKHVDVDTGELIPQSLPYAIDPSVVYDAADWATHTEKGPSYTDYKDYHGPAAIPGYIYIGSIDPDEVFVDNEGVRHFDAEAGTGTFIEGAQTVIHLYEREKPDIAIDKEATPVTVYYGDQIVYNVDGIRNTGNVTFNTMTITENLPAEFQLQSIMTPTFENASLGGTGIDEKFVMLNVYAITNQGREIKWNKYPIQAVTPAVFFRYQLGLNDGEEVTSVKLVFSGKMVGYKRLTDGGYDYNAAFRNVSVFALYGMANTPNLLYPITIQNTVEDVGEYRLTTGFDESVRDSASADVLIHAPSIIDIQKDGPSRVRRETPVRYALTNIGNDGDVQLYETKLIDVLPTKEGKQTTWLLSLNTGTFEGVAEYDISFKTTHARIITQQHYTASENHVININDLLLEEGEEVSEIIYDFGTTPAGFKWLTAPIVELLPKGDMLADDEPFVNTAKVTAFWVSPNDVHLYNDDNDIQKRHYLNKEDSATTVLKTPAMLDIVKTGNLYTVYNGVVDFMLDNVGNGGNTELHHFTMTDTLPEGTTLVGVNTGKWIDYPGKWIKSEFNASYKTNRNDSWTLFPNGSNIGGDENRSLIMPTLPDDEYITAVQFDFGIVGETFRNDPDNMPVISVQVTGQQHANAGTVIVNEVVVNSQFGPDDEPDPNNPPDKEITYPVVDEKRAECEVPVIKPELTLTKTADKELVLMNDDTLTYSLKDLANDSVLYLYGYTVTDVLPAEFTLSSIRTGVWDGYIDTIKVSYRTARTNADGTLELSDYIKLGEFAADANALIPIPEDDTGLWRPYDIKIELTAPVAPGMEIDAKNPVLLEGVVTGAPKDDIITNYARVDAQFGFARNPLDPTEAERELFMPVDAESSVTTYVEYVLIPDPIKTSSKDEVQYGEIFTYAINNIHNDGNTDLVNFRSVDTLPDEVRALSITTPVFNITKDYSVVIVTNKGERKELAKVSTTKAEKVAINLDADEFAKQVILELGEVPAGFCDTSNLYIEVRNISPLEITYTNETVVTGMYHDLEYSSNPATADVTPIKPEPKIPEIDKAADAEKTYPTMLYTYSFGNVHNAGLCMFDIMTVTDRVPAEVKAVSVKTGKYSAELSDDIVSVYYRYSENEDWIKLGESSVNENKTLTFPDAPAGKKVLDVQWRFTKVMPGFGETERPCLTVETLEVVKNGDVIHNNVKLMAVVAGEQVSTEDNHDMPVGPFGIVTTYYREEVSGLELAPSKNTYGFIDAAYDVVALKRDTIGVHVYTRTDGQMTGYFTEANIEVTHWYKPPKTGAAPLTKLGVGIMAIAMFAVMLYWARSRYYNKLTKVYEWPHKRISQR